MGKKSSINISVACGVKINNEIKDIVSFTGSKKDILDFLNYNYAMLQAKYFFKETVVCNLCYNSQEELDDISNWFILEELEMANILVLEENE